MDNPTLPMQKATAGIEHKPHFVIAVCGASCSGKTTVASKLAEKLNEARTPQRSVSTTPNHGVAESLTRRLEGGQSPLQRSRSPSCLPADRDIAETSQALSGDDFFVFDAYGTDSCPTREVNGRVWKDWESIDSIKWDAFIQAVQTAKEDPDCPTFIVVEGFLLLATPESRKLFDAVVNVRLTKEECWSRRKSRADKMKHLPPGFSNGDEERNYEVLPTYVKSDADQGQIRAAAAAQFPDEGDLDWLRLYFEEVIWPAALAQQMEIESCSLPKLELDAGNPPGKEAWQEANFPKALDFVRALLPEKSQ